MSASEQESDASNDLKELREHIQAHPSPNYNIRSYWGRFWYFVSSGLFFLTIGFLLLLYAGNKMGDHHATFTFVLVVLGLALCLFGTGTQGIANINVNPNTAARINASLVGGAGAIAVIVGLGIAYMRNDIRQAFGVEKKYLRLIVRNGTGNSELGAYVSQFEYNGMYVPSMYRGGSVEIMIPFDEDEIPKTASDEIPITVSGIFVKKMDAKIRIRDATLVQEKPVFFDGIKVRRDHFLVQTRGYNFPQHPEKLYVNLEIKRDEATEATETLAPQDEIRSTLDPRVSATSLPSLLPLPTANLR